MKLYLIQLFSMTNIHIQAPESVDRYITLVSQQKLTQHLRTLRQLFLISRKIISPAKTCRFPRFKLIKMQEYKFQSDKKSFL